MTYKHNQKGFSLVELTIVVVILGILATFAVPRYRTSVEKTKASEGLTYLHQVQGQQERFLAWNGRYAKNKRELAGNMGEEMANPNFFSQTAYTSSDWETRWSVRLTRNSASSGFGRYTITWNQDGFVASKSSIPSELKPDGGGSAPLSSGGSTGSSAGSSSSSSTSSGSSSGSTTENGSTANGSDEGDDSSDGNDEKGDEGDDKDKKDKKDKDKKDKDKKDKDKDKKDKDKDKDDEKDD